MMYTSITGQLTGVFDDVLGGCHLELLANGQSLAEGESHMPQH